MDGDRQYSLENIKQFIHKRRTQLITGAIIIFVFSLVYSGKIYKIPYFGPKLLAYSLEKKASSPEVTDLNKLRLKAIGEAIKEGKTEYIFEAPSILGPGGN